MHKYDFEPKALIAWMRLCRSGMVVGDQQQFLVGVKNRLPAIISRADWGTPEIKELPVSKKNTKHSETKSNKTT